MNISRITEVAQHLISPHINEGDICIDATAGNGYDSLFLSQHVGDSGKVYSFDIQSRAIEKSKERLEGNTNVTFFQVSHALLSQNIPEAEHGKISLVMFNLGYLPGGDQHITTETESSVAAFEQSLELLKSGGILCAVLYRGHPEGMDEADAISSWAKRLQADDATVLQYEHQNRGDETPYLLLIQKR